MPHLSPPRLDIRALTTTSAEVNVTVPAGALRTRLQVAADTSFTNPVFDGAVFGATLYEVTGLTPATTYYARARSETAVEETDWAYASPWKTLGLPSGVGSAPPDAFDLIPVDSTRHPVAWLDLNFGDAYGTGSDVTFSFSLAGERDFEGRRYIADGAVLGFDALPASASLEKRKFNIRLSASQHQLGRILNANAYRGKPVNIWLADTDKATGELLARRKFTYYLNSHQVEGNVITLTAENVWGTLDKVRGRRSAQSEQNQLIAGGLFEGIPRAEIDSDLAFNNADDDYSRILLGSIVAEEFRAVPKGQHSFVQDPRDIPANELEFGGAPFEEEEGADWYRPVPFGRTYVRGNLVAAWNPVNVIDQVRPRAPWVEPPEGALPTTRFAAGVWAVSEGVLDDLYLVLSGESSDVIAAASADREFRRTGSGNEGWWRIRLRRNTEEITAVRPPGEERTIAVIQHTLGDDTGGQLDAFARIAGQGEWSSRHQGYGTALVGVIFPAWVGWNQEVPKIVFYTSGVRVQQDAAATTFGATENPALLLRHLLLHKRYGARLSPEQVDEQSFFDGAPRYSRQFVTGRYETAVRGVLTSRQTIRKSLEGICNCSQSLLVSGHDGRVKLRARGVLTPEERAKRDAHVFGLHNTARFQVKQRDSDSRYNAANVETFVMDKNPGDKYSIEVQVDDALEEDGGDLRELRVKANSACALLSPSGAPLESTLETLREIGRRAVVQSRLLRSGSFQVPDGLWSYPDLEPGDVVFFEEERQGFVGDFRLQCRIDRLDVDHNGTYLITFSEYSDAAYNLNLPTTVRTNPQRLGPARNVRVIRPGETLDRLGEVPVATFALDEDVEVPQAGQPPLIIPLGSFDFTPTRERGGNAYALSYSPAVGLGEGYLRLRIRAAINGMATGAKNYNPSSGESAPFVAQPNEYGVQPFGAEVRQEGGSGSYTMRAGGVFTLSRYRNQ